MKYKFTAIIIGALLLAFLSYSYSQRISNTKHNLSSTGPGSVKATEESEICIFCHTPHSTSAKTPLWNRSDPTTGSYTLYSSSTLHATMGTPDGTSLMCLSCHDGSIALGSVLSQSSAISFGSITTMPTGNTNLTRDLSNDHPISFVYNSTLASSNTELKNPANIDNATKLRDSKMQCTSCHDPHYTANAKFLVLTNQNSTLCLSCHQKTYWSNSTHKSSTSTWNGSGTNPWAHTTYNNVANNACENCHNPHNAGGNKRLLNYSNEENNCLNCHNGNVATTNIQAQLNKSYKHNVGGYLGTHDPTENNLVGTKHVECTDCHNPHASKSSTASAPNVNGFLAGVKGVDTDGNDVNPATYQYQICYRCHSSSSWRQSSPTTRAIDQNNVRLEFDTGNPSYHPIEGAGRNNNVPSLITTLSENSIIYCTDCHASDGTSPKGPHGSSYPRILKYQYVTADNTSESYNNYRLCYECHSRTSILNDESFSEHRKHIVEEDTPCNACHDPHGISSTQGSSSNNSNLINFDINIVSAYNGNRRFEDRGSFTGRCYLRCHGETHNPLSYP